MIEVSYKIFVGNQYDYESLRDALIARPANTTQWAIVQACKFPYHRAALGYTSAAAPRGHPEYLVAIREGESVNRIILNMIDAPQPEFFATSMIESALLFVKEHKQAGDHILIHCNKGESRAPSIALLHLARTGELPTASYEAAAEAFIKKYPGYKPGAGIKRHLAEQWQHYIEPASGVGS